MSPNLQVVAALDLDRNLLLELLVRAQSEAHPRVVARLLRLIAENSAAWDRTVKPQRVEES